MLFTMLFYLLMRYRSKDKLYKWCQNLTTKKVNQLSHPMDLRAIILRIDFWEDVRN